jgi:ribose 5-phosphate isomerase
VKLLLKNDTLGCDGAPIAGPVVTDNGNFVIDAPFDREKMQNSSKVSEPEFPGLSDHANLKRK